MIIDGLLANCWKKTICFLPCDESREQLRERVNTATIAHYRPTDHCLLFVRVNEYEHRAFIISCSN